MNGLEMKDLSVGYDKKVLVKDISLSVKSGEILTLIGPNGAGKSTILKTITRQLASISGCIYLDEMDMKRMSGKDIAKFQSMVMTNRIDPELFSCLDVVSTGRYPYTNRLGILSEEDKKIVEESIKIVHATEVRDMDFSKISDGQRQRIMLARALCQEPKVLILDEPTSFLDLRYKMDLLGSIRRIAKEKNIAVIMSLHELELAAWVSDLIACVDGEKISCVGTKDEVFASDAIQKLYGISKEHFDATSCQIIFPKVQGKAEVFVIGGNGSGLSTYQKLWRDQTPFSAGILWENDIEFTTAKSLTDQLFYAKAFHSVDEDVVVQAKACIDGCKKVILTREIAGEYDEKNLELMEYAKSQGKL